MRYEDAGVSMERAEELIGWLKGKTKGIGSFSARVVLGDRVILLSVDGVGTKILLALEYYKKTGKSEVLKWIGQDLVAMVSNDILADGGKTEFFLDYYATGRLNPEVAKPLLEGVIEACGKVGAKLVGGETAELPDMLPQGVFDVAGFGVGTPIKGRLERVRSGDVLIAFPSSGFHSNGFSLIRKVLRTRNLNITRVYTEAGRRPLAELLLKPTRLYWRVGREMFLKFNAKRGAHITGGGITENVLRATDGRGVEIHWDRLKIPRVMRFVLREGDIPDEEARRVFNLGVGFVFVVRRTYVKEILKRFRSAFVLGEVV